MPSFSITPIVAADLSFVRGMLYEAAFWRGTADAPSLDIALSRSDLAVYVQDWGRPGDVGLIARVGRRPGLVRFGCDASMTLSTATATSMR